MRSTEELEQQIERMVRSHLADCQEAVKAAVERVFAAAIWAAPGGQEGQKKVTSRKAQSRRSSDELVKLSERLYEVVCATPGESMTVLAAKLGMSPRSLQIPVGRLKREGRVRSVGKRQFMRYFPKVKDKTTTEGSMATVGRAS